MCGFNITIVAGLFVTIFGKLLGKRRGALAATLGIALYSVLVGPSASVLRAALMGGLGLLAR
ncbi:MAG TPA: ComEC/Rec2 family competence protein [Anaerolineales bacterium]